MLIPLLKSFRKLFKFTRHGVNKKTGVNYRVDSYSAPQHINPSRELKILLAKRRNLVFVISVVKTPTWPQKVLKRHFIRS